MEDLGFDNILSDLDMDNLFGGESEEEKGPVQQQNEDDTVDKVEVDGNKEPTEVNPNSFFGGLDTSESVGVDNDDKGGEDKNPGNADSSPNFYSSILSALKDEGVLPELTDEEIDGFEKNNDFNGQDMIDVFNKIIDSRVDARHKRIEDALNGGADIEEVRQYETILATLTNIDEGTISEEGPKGEDLRRRVIAQDLMNKGFSKERIERELKKSFEAGTDIEDAKESLQNNIQFYNAKYQGIIAQGQENDRQFRENTRRQADELRKSIVESDEGIFKEIGIDKRTRQKIYDSISKPAFKDEDGNVYTELQKYQMDNKNEFLKNVAMFYVMTDGFKNIDKVIKKQVQKKNKNYMADLEKKLSNTQRTNSGALKMVGQGDPESQYLGENFILDI